MPLEWKTTRVGNVDVTHWARHDPRRILDTLETPPLRKVGIDPVVRVHQFGNHELAARRFVPPQWRDAGKRLFSLLQETVGKKAAVVEMPVALIEHPNRQIIVSLWKKGTRHMNDFIDDKTVPVSTKKKFCLSVMRRMAQLHAAGFEHGHIALNFVADEKGNAYFVDYTRLKPLAEGSHSHKMEKKFTLPLTSCIYPEIEAEIAVDLGTYLRHVASGKRLPGDAGEFEAKLEEEYAKWLPRYKAKFQK